MPRACGPRDPLLGPHLRLRPRQTDWPIQPSFIPFLDLTLQHARAATALETSWPPGDLYSLDLPEDRQVAEVVVRREGTEETP